MVGFPETSHLSTTILLPVSLSHINQVSIIASSVSTQVSDGKGSEKFAPMEHLGDNEFKGSPHPLQGHLHFNRDPTTCRNHSLDTAVVAL